MPNITPSGLTYGTVIGLFKTIEIDSSDSDKYPQHYPMRGTVKFTPSIRHSQYITEDGDSVTFYRTDIIATLDKDGYLTSGARSDSELPPDETDRGVQLLASDNPLLQPSGWTWNVTMQLESTTGAGITNTQPFSITVLGGQEIDLTKVMPLSP